MNEQALKDRVHAIAKEKGIPFNECWKQLLLVRFLARLSYSRYSEKLIKNANLLIDKGASFNPNNPQGYIYSQLYQFQHFGRNDIWRR